MQAKEHAARNQISVETPSHSDVVHLISRTGLGPPVDACFLKSIVITLKAWVVIGCHSNNKVSITQSELALGAQES